MENIFSIILRALYLFFFNGGAILLFIILIFSTPFKKKEGDYFETLAEENKLTARKNIFIKRYLLVLIPSFIIFGLIFQDSKLQLSLFALPFTILLTTSETMVLLFSIQGIVIFTIATLICISKLSNKLKVLIYLVALFLLTLLGRVNFNYIWFNAIICLMYSLIEIKKGALFVDNNDCKLSNKQIIYRNAVKFLCLYVAIIPFIYYVKTKEILWDKLTDTRYI